MPTESSAAPARETLLVLPLATDAWTLAAACRQTARAFLRDSERWGSAELVAWLVGPYAQVTQHHAAYARRQTGQHGHPLPGLRDVDTRMIERVLRFARAEVSTRLESMRDPEGGARFAFGMMSAGFVARCKDTHGTSGWAPTSTPSRLADRVLSLVATDYLGGSTDYDGPVSLGRRTSISAVCPRRTTVPFGVQSA